MLTMISLLKEFLFSSIISALNEYERYCLFHYYYIVYCIYCILSRKIYIIVTYCAIYVIAIIMVYRKYHRKNMNKVLQINCNIMTLQLL